MAKPSRSSRWLFVSVALSLIATCCIFAALVTNGAEEAPLEAYWFDGFPGALSPQILPSPVHAFRDSAPSEVTLRGMNDAIVLALRAVGDAQGVMLRATRVVGPGGAQYAPELTTTSDQPLGCEVLVVSHCQRDLARLPYLYTLIERCATLKQNRSVLVPELLVHDLQAFAAGRDKYRPGDPPPLGSPGVAKVGELPKDSIAYFVFRYRVSREAPAGEYRIELTAQPGDTTLAVKLTVLSQVLPRSSKYLCLSAEFADQHHLRAFTDAGLTFIRTRNASRWADRDQRFRELASLGVKALVQHIPPESRQEVAGLPKAPVLYFYGMDEPQPKRGQPGREDWSRMAEHVQLSQRIHALGGLVGTSLPFELAESLANKDGKAYQYIAQHGVQGLFEPLDWSSYGLGIQRLRPGRAPERRILDLGEDAIWIWDYIKSLQADLEAGRISPKTGLPVSRRARLETCYFPLGFMRDPFFARYMFGAFTAESGLDGVMAWTAMRPRGKNIFDDSDGPDALVALPTATGIATTYSFEALRAGVNDLRIIECLRGMKDAQVEELLKPWRLPMVDGKRLDMLRGESGLADLRRSLLERVRAYLRNTRTT